ncbi:MAG: ATP-binding protein [Candidatus Promineifilaceae bacterium]
MGEIFDPHFVCAAAVAGVAEQCSVQAVMALNSASQDSYDVWIAGRDSELIQERWHDSGASFGAIASAGKAVMLDKLDRPISELVSSELWLRAQDQIMAVPVLYGTGDENERQLGVLCLLDPPSRDTLTLDDLNFLALGLKVYLDRAALRRKADQQEIEFSVVAEISHMLSSTLSMDRIFSELTGTIRHILQVEALSVGLVEPDSGDTVFVESLMGVPSGTLPVIRVKPGQGIAGWVVEQGEPVIVNDVYADSRFYPAPDRKSGFKTRSMICIPLRVESNTIGVLQAINRRYGQFTARDLSLLQAIGAPLAAAIENSRLHADVLSEKRRVETILGNMSDGLLAVSASGYITRFNEALTTLLMVDGEEIAGMEVHDLFRSVNAELAGLVDAAIARRDDSVQSAFDLTRGNGESLPVLVSGAPNMDEHGTVNEVILTISDLTQIREVERMRDDLFHAIAHELRTPLATILMYARLLLEGKAQDEEKAARFLGVIERESDRLQYMVRRMMQLAKQESRDWQRSPEPVLLSAILEDILPPLVDQAQQKGLYFRKHIDADLPPFLADEERVEEIVYNLVGNAIKFTPSGTIRVSALAENSRVVLRVSDEGIGIPRQAIPYLYKRFFRAEPAVERGIAGSGLGLYMVKQSVEQYNGIIEVESEEGSGTTFTVSFPVYEI